ncbi:hypothetical protein Hanom_Chr15g01340631 [Helianthus anomalus]
MKRTNFVQTTRNTRNCHIITCVSMISRNQVQISFSSLIRLKNLLEMMKPQSWVDIAISQETVFFI